MLHRCIALSDGAGTPSAKMIATAFEAILGAVHRDGGIDSLAGVMDRLGLTQHVLLSPVTSLLLFDVILCRIAAALLGLLGPFAACPRLPSRAAPEYAFEG